MDFAMKQAASGDRVLYLTFNKNLSNNLLENGKDIKNLKIINIHAFFGEYVPVDIKKVEADAQTYFSQTLPEEFFEYLGALTEEELEAFRYDLLILDEGQDILRPNFLYPLDYLLKGGLEKGRWAVFYDERQNIYNPDFEEGMGLLNSYPHAKFTLRTNCRNTIQIGSYSETVSGWKLGSFLKENGEEVQKIRYSSEEEFKERITRILKELRKESIRMRDITFLSPKRYEKSILGRANIAVNEIREDMNPDLDVPRFATIHGFKGLDAGIIIFCGAEDIYEQDYARFMYIATTRARTLLYIARSSDFWEARKKQGYGKMLRGRWKMS